MKNNRIISLQDIIADIKDEEYIKEKILKQFKSRDRNSIEDFLHNKAINFEKSSLSATHLIRNDKSGEILGYFTFANKKVFYKGDKESFNDELINDTICNLKAVALVLTDDLNKLNNDIDRTKQNLVDIKYKYADEFI